MTVKRETLYVHVSWLTRLLVGDACCEWGPWFKTQHAGQSYARVPSTFDRTRWLMEHTSLAREIHSRLKAEGKTVCIEQQNSFALNGRAASLHGQPDLIATSGSRGIILDAKTGKPSPAHHAQVLIYMYAVPRCLPQYQGVSFDGKVVYRDHEVDIPCSAVDKKFVDNLGALVRRLSSPDPARKVPSPVECGFCEITKADCPERIAEETIRHGETSDF